MADMTIDEIMALGEAHTKAMTPKKKKKKIGMKPSNPVGLAASQIKAKQSKSSGMLNDFMTGKPKIKR